MSFKTVHILDFSIFDIESKDMLIGYICKIDFSRDFVVCVGNPFEEASTALVGSNCYKVNASLPEWQLHYFVAFLALANGVEQSVEVVNPLIDCAIPLSDISPGASDFLFVFSRKKDKIAISHDYAIFLESLNGCIAECGYGLIRGMLRDFTRFLSSSNEFLCAVLDAKKSTFADPKIEIFDVIKSLRNYSVSEEFVVHFNPRFASQIRTYTVFAKVIRQIAQGYSDLTRVCSFPRYFSVLVISFENSSREFLVTRDHSGYLIAKLRGVEILMTGKLLEEGLASYNAAGKLMLTHAGVSLHQRFSAHANAVKPRLLGLFPIMLTLFYKGILSEQQKNRWGELIEFRNSLKETHGFVVYNGSSDFDLDNLYEKLKTQCLSGEAKKMYVGLSKEIEKFTLGNFWREYFLNEIQESWK